MFNMKRSLAATLVALMIITSIGLPAAGSTTNVVYLASSSTTMNVDQTKTIQLGLEGFDANEIITVEVHLQYDAEQLEWVQDGYGNPFTLSSWYNNNGARLTLNQNELDGNVAKIAFSLKPNSQLNSVGEFASFQVKALQAGQAEIEISKSLVIYKEHPGHSTDHEAQSISLKVNNKDGTPGPTPSPSPSPSPSPAPGTGKTPPRSPEPAPTPPEQRTFTDQALIDRLTWAMPAINELVKLGIMEGDNKGNFRPNDTMKREEFAKVMASVINLDQPLQGIENLTKKAQTGAYQDIAQNRWSNEYVKVVAEYGLMQGNQMGGSIYFEPGKGVTRAELAMVFYRFLTQLHPEVVVHQAHTFTDVSESHWAAEAIALMQQEGIVTGKTENTFAPGELATRAEVAVMIYRILQYEPVLH